MIPVVLSGGSGTRLWPISRSKYPKQFADLFDESLLTKTFKRLKTLGTPWTITTADLKVLTDRVYKDLKLETNAIYEPFGRNTAPAIAALVKHFESKGWSDKVVGIFPADHFVEKEADYIEALRLAEELAGSGSVVTIGIHPTFPATGYGYIETENKTLGQKGKFKALRAKGFREKPDAKTAQTFLDSGNFYWNAGMFVFKVSKMIELFKQHQSALWNEMQNLKSDLSNIEEVYKKTQGISIDYAIMEKLPEHVCIPCDIGWNDVGSWDEVSKLKENSESRVEVGGSGNFVLTQYPKTFAFVDVSDLVVVDTSDATLIARKGSSQKVKDVVDKLKASSNKSDQLLLAERNFEIRPWGRFEVLRDTEDFKSKVIQVEPGQQLSYQSHKKRAEHWIIVKGKPEVVLNDVVHKLQPGESIYIPLEAKHRIRNPGTEVVEFVEVQVGTYFGEDDITRYQDDYKRT